MPKHCPSTRGSAYGILRDLPRADDIGGGKGGKIWQAIKYLRARLSDSIVKFNCFDEVCKEEVEK